MSKKSRSVWSKGATQTISGVFAPRLIEMLRSPAYQVLSLAAHKVLARIEIELANHGGTRQANGRLPVTFDHFEEYGLHRRSIAPAIREVEALGFVEVTQRGCGGNANFKQPSMYRLTYRPAEGAPSDGSHEWRRITDLSTAAALAEQARNPTRQKQKAGGRKRHRDQWQKVHRSGRFPRWQKVPLPIYLGCTPHMMMLTLRLTAPRAGREQTPDD